MKRIYTIDDFYPGFAGMFDGGVLEKTDAPVVMGTTGVKNALYGPKIMSQLVTEANVFGVLPKRPWERSGYRAITAAGISSGLGTTEAAVIKDTVKPTFAEIPVAAKLMHVSFDMSTLQQHLEGKDDVVTWANLVEEMSREFGKSLNADLCTDLDTLAGTNCESIDRVTGSYSEVTAGLCTAGDADIYGLDRDAAATYADGNCLHASGTDRTLSISLIDELIQTQLPYWNDASMNNKVFITGYDTLFRWSQLLQPQMRLEPMNVQTGINGIKSVPGGEGGFVVSSYNGIPIIPSNNVAQDTISRIYLLDLDTLEFGLLNPVETKTSEDYQGLDKFVQEGIIFMEGELICTKFKAQGKLRDLK